jgi:hypothetical protein
MRHKDVPIILERLDIMQRTFNIVEVTYSNESHGMDRKIIKRNLKPSKAQAVVDRLNEKALQDDLSGESGSILKSYLLVPAEKPS